MALSPLADFSPLSGGATTNPWAAGLAPNLTTSMGGGSLQGPGMLRSPVYGATPTPGAPAFVSADAASAQPSAADQQDQAAVNEFQQAHDNYYKSLEGIATKLNGIQLPDFKALEASVKPFQAPKQTNPMQGWAGAAMVFAAFGSLLTRRPLTTAMNAMAGALDAVKSGDQQALDNAYKIWQGNTEQAIKLGNFEMEAYKAAVDDVMTRLELGQKLSVAEQQDAYAKLMATGAAVGNENIQHILQTQGLPGAFDAIAKQQEVLQNFTEGQSKVEQAYQQQQSIAALKASPEWKLMPPEVRLRRINEIMNPYLSGYEMTPEDLDARAKLGATGNLQEAYRGIPYGPSGAAARTALGQKIAQANPNLARSVLEYTGVRSALVRGGAREAQISIAANEADQMANLALKASDNVDRGPIASFNAAALRLQAEVNDPAVIDFVTKVNSFIQVYSRAVAPTGVPTDNVRNHIYQLIGTSQDKEGFAAAIHAMKQEMEIAKKAPQEFMDQMTATLGLGDSGGGAATPNDESFSAVPVQ